MKLSGVIFDLDGTLLDSMAIWETVGDEYLLMKGCIPASDLWDKIKTLSLLEAAPYLRDEYNLKESIEEICLQVNAVIEYKYFSQVQFKPTALPFIRKLDQMGVRMCIATATDRHLAEAALRRLDSLDYFCGILTCTEVGSGKDQPLIYERALELLNTKKEETIVFEDAIHAIETAKKAGFMVAGVYDASADRDWDQIKKTANWFIDSFEEMELNHL